MRGAPPGYQVGEHRYARHCRALHRSTDLAEDIDLAASRERGGAQLPLAGVGDADRGAQCDDLVGVLDRACLEQFFAHVGGGTNGHGRRPVHRDAAASDEIRNDRLRERVSP